jgi:predicted RNase H-like nuclease
LIQNRLGHPEHPDWESWGGHYTMTDIAAAGKHYNDPVDRAIG